jgi:hypothetical protein
LCAARSSPDKLAALGRGCPESLSVGIEGSPDVPRVDDRVVCRGFEQFELVVEYLDARGKRDLSEVGEGGDQAP